MAHICRCCKHVPRPAGGPDCYARWTYEAILRLALDSPSVQRIDRLQLVKWLVTTYTLQGRLDEAEDVLATIPPGGDALNVARRHAEIALARGDFEAALAPFERLHAQHAAYGSSNPAELLWLQDYAAALAGAGRRAEAVALMEDFLARAERFGAALPVGTAHLSLGALREGRAAREHFEQAHAVLEPSPYRWNAARAQVALGGSLRRDGERAAARELLREALEYAARNDVAPLIERAQDELARLGMRPRRLIRYGVEALTPSEARICRLAAAGKTNKEIAQELFLSVKTVESHLLRAFRTLGVSSRRDIAAALDEPTELAPGPQRKTRAARAR